MKGPLEKEKQPRDKREGEERGRQRRRKRRRRRKEEEEVVLIQHFCILHPILQVWNNFEGSRNAKIG